MTTQPANLGGGSDRWAAIDAAGTAQREAARLDINRDGQSYQRRVEVWHSLLDVQPGQRVIEVGPGTGAFAQQMAARVGPTGSVVGVDVNASMVALATERAAGSGLPVTFQQGDVHRLEFPDGTFDTSFAVAVFLHIDDPLSAIKEMVRVTRPGGRVVISEPDFETTIFDAPDVEASRAVSDAFLQNLRDPRIGRKLPRMFKQAGLADVATETVMMARANRAELWARFDFAGAVQRAVQAGKLSQERADAWIASQDAASEEGTFFYGFISFSVAGRKP